MRPDQVVGHQRDDEVDRHAGQSGQDGAARGPLCSRPGAVAVLGGRAAAGVAAGGGDGSRPRAGNRGGGGSHRASPFWVRVVRLRKPWTRPMIRISAPIAMRMMLSCRSATAITMSAAPSTIRNTGLLMTGTSLSSANIAFSLSGLVAVGLAVVGLAVSGLAGAGLAVIGARGQ